MKWKDIKVGDVLKDGSIVTGIHRTHIEKSCKITYDTNRTFICSYNHVLLIDISNLPKEGKDELEKYCTFVPLEESYEIDSDVELTDNEKLIVEQYFHNEDFGIDVEYLGKQEDYDIYKFNFASIIKTVRVKTIIINSEPQKVDENTYWLPCIGIKYLMDKYNVPLYCNSLLINKIEDAGMLPCFCITTNTGRYET